MVMYFQQILIVAYVGFFAHNTLTIIFIIRFLIVCYSIMNIEFRN